MMQQLGYAGLRRHSEDKQKRADLFECWVTSGNDPEVIQQARVMVQQYMKDPTSVDPTLAGAAVSVAARHGDAALYNQFKAQLKKVKSPQQYYRFFYALAEFPQPALIKQTLESTLTPAVRGQDLYDSGAPAGESRPARMQTWDFMRQNFDADHEEDRRRTGRQWEFSSMARRASAARKRRTR